MDNWYSPKEITFHRDQVIFLIRHLELLSEGVYPPNPSELGYSEAPITKKGRSKVGAYFETPVGLAAEIKIRLKQTGADGELLIEELKADYLLLSYKARTALNYISGWQRRWMKPQNISYAEWKEERKDKYLTRINSVV